jgi:ABC-type Zn uptake system ZnuABC Zn-binding protein ZnuA
MKYNFVMTRTFRTKFNVVADNIEEAQQWIDDNMDDVWEAELEQCNVIDDERVLEEAEPSPNEVSELQDLVQHINLKLQQYSHVEDFIPQELYKALEQMLSHDEN